jgi:ribosomal protein L18
LTVHFSENHFYCQVLKHEFEDVLNLINLVAHQSL